MIEGAIWRRWVFFRLPMAIFLIFLLFPFYMDDHHDVPARW